MKYSVAIRYDAVQWIDVEANTPEQASEKATRRAGASLCHECSRRLEVGEYLGCQVLDESGELLLEDR